MKKLITTVLMLLYVGVSAILAQDKYELDNGWKCLPSQKTKDVGETISKQSYSLSKWQPAVVPGTVLTTQLANKEVPDPFYGMNNERIPDIYNTGREYYTYWFVKDFKESVPQNDDRVWLTFRGINYSCDIFINGKKINSEPYEGMFLRKTFDISPYLAKDGNNRLAVIVYPPDPVGNPNGGQGGDGTIAKGVAHQYVAGWDWIQPIRDRNTGIWDKVFIEKTGSVNLKNPHIITLVPGKRKVEGKQAPATIKVTAELENASNKSVQGKLQYSLNGQTVSQDVTLAANSTKEIALPNFIMENPKLWWPAGYGDQNLYNIKIEFIANGKTSDAESVTFGVREMQQEWNITTRSMQVAINGQKIFIKGGNWIISDAMLRFSKERYDTEIRFHRDMNLNLIRIWGGALAERPEFYDACDKYGLLVIQDFWMSGDCNGRWVDPMKLEDQWTRRKYPDNHSLFLESAADMIKMIRNHASLAIWCGGNEITPPDDILVSLRDSILPELDGTRWFIDYSNSDEMSFNSIGGNGDGPYGIQDIRTFWGDRTFPFNSEVGSVGVGDYESLLRFIPTENLIAPEYNPAATPRHKVDSVWQYHKYIGYDQYVEPYGKAKDAKDFAMKAQLLNYDQYRALMEGFSSHMWTWYTGSIIWKTQNPWTAMRGQMYDYYLDPNACLYGLRSGSEPLHIMYNPVDSMVMVVNNGFENVNNVMAVVKTHTMAGEEKVISREIMYMNASSAKPLSSLKRLIPRLCNEDGGFITLQLVNANGTILSENFYWLPNAKGIYSGLQKMRATDVEISARRINDSKVEVSVSNKAGNTIAFFNRISLVDSKTKERILPAFYSDNYISVTPDNKKTVIVEYNPKTSDASLEIMIEGWNVKQKSVSIK
ncbi:glycoside hydrolase family 2 TIM barrel-domain containing protein [Dysgonomonas sp. ZJ709]|uniref:glycoside hydrolase family 2 protein n=1 Tax=Dysgonomonas sp. ZJ709 TaxID=2709797 RepID=UPI0013EA05A9|nr:glycoside hydrolase family 2 TIM barrel-domain containing protein [Dysgonomonas sp. ZJ709]